MPSIPLEPQDLERSLSDMVRDLNLQKPGGALEFLDPATEVRSKIKSLREELAALTDDNTVRDLLVLQRQIEELWPEVRTVYQTPRPLKFGT